MQKFMESIAKVIFEKLIDSLDPISFFEKYGDELVDKLVGKFNDLDDIFQDDILEKLKKKLEDKWNINL